MYELLHESYNLIKYMNPKVKYWVQIKFQLKLNWFLPICVCIIDD